MAVSKVAKFKDLLGKMPDAKVAEMADVLEAAVGRYRTKLGIAPFKADDEASPKEEVAEEGEDPPASRESLLDGLDEDEIAEAIASATAFLEARGYAVTAPGAEPKPAAALKPPPTVKVKATAQLRRPEGGLPMRVNRGDVFSGPKAAWLWTHHRDAVKPYGPR